MAAPRLAFTACLTKDLARAPTTPAVSADSKRIERKSDSLSVAPLPDRLLGANRTAAPRLRESAPA